MWWPNWLRLIGLPNVAIYLTRNGKYPRKRELWYYWCLGKHLECLPFCDTHIIYSKKRQLRWWRSSFFTLKLMRRAQVVEVSRYWWTSGRRMAHVLQNYVRILSDHKKSLFLRVVGIRRDSENCSCDCYYRDTFSQGLETTDENHLSFDCKSVALWPVFLPLKKMLSLKCVGVLFVVGILFIGESQATILRNIVIGK